MIVLDTSATIELLLDSAAGRRVAERIADAAEGLHAPELLWVEAVHVLRRLCATDVVSERRAGDALADLTALDVTYASHEVLVGRAWQLRHNLSAYDATFVALAELLNAPLLTADARLAKAAGTSVAFEVV